MVPVDDIDQLRERAGRWRALASQVTDARATKVLNETAEGLEETIARLEAERVANPSGAEGAADDFPGG
jgi:hypothetical protein